MATSSPLGLLRGQAVRSHDEEGESYTMEEAVSWEFEHVLVS